MQTLPREIRKGMSVFDSARNRIGTVEDFRFSENEEQPGTEPADLDMTDKVEDSSLIEDVARAFAPDDMPEELRERLLREGYIRIDSAGLFEGDRYILPEQIDRVSGDEVLLKVEKNELMTRH